MAYRNGYRSGGARSFQRLMDEGDGMRNERSPRRRRTRKGKPRSAPGKRGSAKARSREFLEGQLYERDRMDGYRRPPDFYGDEPTNSDRYNSETGYGRRIGYRS